MLGTAMIQEHESTSQSSSSSSKSTIQSLESRLTEEMATMNKKIWSMEVRHAAERVKILDKAHSWEYKNAMDLSTMIRSMESEHASELAKVLEKLQSMESKHATEWDKIQEKSKSVQWNLRKSLTSIKKKMRSMESRHAETVFVIKNGIFQVKRKYHKIQQQNLELRQELNQVARDLRQESEHRDETLRQDIYKLAARIEQTQQAITSQDFGDTCYTYAGYPEKLDDYHQFSEDDALLEENSLCEKNLKEYLLEDSTDDWNPLLQPAQLHLESDGEDTNIPKTHQWQGAIRQ
ncbi:hypothetical protein BGZ81_011212 [Podila clonocystis]|nr:hypothetical protein BGZ81_011212 [Podila clonocystis]